MKINEILFLIIVTSITISCKNINTPIDIIQKTIDGIDTIETIYYKQDMIRTNPGNTEETIYRYREICFKRLIEDSIVGVKGHWYMYVDDKINVIYEDIYDGEKLIRKNNRDSIARVYDLVQYPEFRNSYFWGHNTPYSMQYMFKNILRDMELYEIKRLNDTVYQNTDCFQILIRLENKESMPGFAYKLQDKKGNVSLTKILFDKVNYYPIQVRMENYSINNPGQIFFTEQTYFDLRFNITLDTKNEFNTSGDMLIGYEINKIKP